MPGTNFIQGSNALKALEGLGVLEAVLSQPDHLPAMRPFRFIAGEGEHEHIYDVSDPCDTNMEGIMLI